MQGEAFGDNIELKESSIEKRMEGTSKRIIHSSFMRVADLVSGIAISFFFMPFLVHTLGDDWYGVWTIIGSLTGTYYLLDFGLASAVTRYVTYAIARREGDAANNVINTSLAIYSGLAILVVAVTAGAAHFAVPVLVDSDKVRAVQFALVLVGATLAAEFPFKAFAGIVGAYMRYDLLAWSHIGARAVNIGACVTLLINGHGIVAMAAVGLVTSGIQNVAFYLLARYLFSEMRVETRYISRRRAKDLIGYSSWAFVVSVANILRTKFDAVVIGGFLTTTHVTHYFIGARLAELVFTLLLRATNLGMPLLTRYHGERNDAAVREAVLLMTKINAVLGGGAVGVVLLVGEAFIGRWMGVEYDRAYFVAMILLVGLLIFLVVNPLDNALFAVSKHRALAYIAVLEAVANLLLSIWLLKTHGIVGVAIGTAIPLVITRGLILPYYACRQLAISMSRYVSIVGRALSVPATFFLAVLTLVGTSRIGSDYLDIVAYAFALMPPYLLASYRFVLDAPERAIVRSAMAKAVTRERSGRVRQPANGGTT